MTSNWEKRFPNPHTRPDPDDSLIRKVAEDEVELFGRSVVDTAIDVPGYLRELKKKWETPEYQDHVAQQEQAEREHRAHQAEYAYRRQIENLSRLHVKAVIAGCDASLNPITTTEIQRKLIAKWDGVQSVFLLGRTGIGKTYAATWGAMRQARKGRDVASATPDRVARLSLEALIRLQKTDVVILDQLHTLRSSAGRDEPSWKVSPVVDLIDYRYENELTTIGAGTVEPEEMFAVLGDDMRRRFPLRLASESTEVRR